MPKAVKISDEPAKTAAVFAGVEGRSLAGQVEYWAKLGRIADENQVLLLALGAHENFYRDLKRYLT
jgi:hypothetical protein